MRASESKEWPWRPNYITNDGKEVGPLYEKRGPLKDLIGVGILSNEHLQGIQTTISVKLKYPTTMIEFTAKGKTVRTDSILVDSSIPPFGMSPTCKVFRELMGCKHCYDGDDEHARLFWKLNESDFPKEVEKRIEASEYIQQNIENNPKLTIEPRLIEYEDKDGKSHKRWILEYDCPLMGGREILFPVFFEKKVVAVFIAGQIRLKKNRVLMKQIQKQFFETHKVKKQIVLEISKTHDECVDDKNNLLNVSHYRELVSDACNELDELEETLNEQMGLQRNEVVRERIDLLIENFRRNMPTKEEPSEKKWDKLWQNTKKQLEKICSFFNIGYIIVFANKSSANNTGIKLDVVANTKRNLPEVFERMIHNKKLKFNLSKLPEEIRHRWITSVEDKRVFNGVEDWGGYHDKKNLVRVFPVPFFPQASLAVLIGYNENNPLMSPENKPGGHLDTALQSFYTVVLSTLSAVSAAIAEEHSEKVLDSAIEAVVGTLDRRDPKNAKHSRRVADHMMAINEQLHAEEEPKRSEFDYSKDTQNSRRIGLLHDVGKVGMPDDVLQGIQNLSPGSKWYREIHPHASVAIIEQIEGLDAAIVQAVSEHHERFAGEGGYLHKINDKKISRLGANLSVADAYDSMKRSRGSWRGLSQLGAYAQLLRLRGTKLNPIVVDAFLNTDEFKEIRKLLAERARPDKNGNSKSNAVLFKDLQKKKDKDARRNFLTLSYACTILHHEIGEGVLGKEGGKIFKDITKDLSLDDLKEPAKTKEMEGARPRAIKEHLWWCDNDDLFTVTDVRDRVEESVYEKRGTNKSSERARESELAFLHIRWKSDANIPQEVYKVIEEEVLKKKLLPVVMEGDVGIIAPRCTAAQAYGLAKGLHKVISDAYKSLMEKEPRRRKKEKKEFEEQQLKLAIGVAYVPSADVIKCKCIIGCAILASKYAQERADMPGAIVFFERHQLAEV